MSSYEDILVIGIKGGAGSGKTTLARRLDEDLAHPTRGLNLEHAQVDHLAFAAPLYEMAAVRSNIKGAFAEDRKLYAIHNIVTSLLGTNPLFGAPPYSDLVDIVHTILHDIPLRGDKPRSFLLEVAKLMRAYKDDCFVQRLETAMKYRYHLVIKDGNDDKDDVYPEVTDYIAVISDLRYEIEGEMVRKYPNNILIELAVDDDTKAQRARENGDVMSYPEVLDIEKECLSWENIHPDAVFDASVDASELYRNVVEYLGKRLKRG